MEIADMELNLTARFQEMDRLHPWLLEAASAFSISDDTLSMINLCLEEMVLNIIKYGYDTPNAEGKIDLRLSPMEDSIILQIEDNAQPFNPVEHQGRPQPLSLNETAVGGLGIELVRNFSTSMEHERVGDRNHLTVTFPREA